MRRIAVLWIFSTLGGCADLTANIERSRGLPIDWHFWFLMLGLVFIGQEIRAIRLDQANGLNQIVNLLNAIERRNRNPGGDRY